MKNVDEYIRDIEIVKNALKETHIGDVVKDRKLLCDVYCIPSHNHQAFYLQVYDGEEYALVQSYQSGSVDFGLLLQSGRV